MAKVRLGIRIFTLAVSLAGCTVPPAPHDFKKTRTYAQPFDAVWQKTIQFFVSNNIEIKTIEKSSGVIYAEFGDLPVTNDAMDCGQPGLAVIVGDVGQFNVFVVPNSGNNTTVSINDDFQQTRTPLGSNRSVTIPCTSTGVLEQQILSSLGD